MPSSKNNYFSAPVPAPAGAGRDKNTSPARTPGGAFFVADPGGIMQVVQFCVICCNLVGKFSTMESTKNTTYLEQAWERHSAAISVMNENNRTAQEYIAFLADWAVDALPFEVEEEDEEFEK